MLIYEGRQVKSLAGFAQNVTVTNLTAKEGHVPVGAPQLAKSIDAIVAAAGHDSAILPSARPSVPVAQLDDGREGVGAEGGGR